MTWREDRDEAADSPPPSAPSPPSKKRPLRPNERAVLACTDMDLDALFPGQERTTHKPTRDDLPLAAFEVIHVAGAPHVYVTRGAVEHGRDFALYAPKADAWLVDVLTSVAYFQSFYGLEVGQTYKFARGWLPGSMLNRFLVSS